MVIIAKFYNQILLLGQVSNVLVSSSTNGRSNSNILSEVKHLVYIYHIGCSSILLPKT